MNSTSSIVSRREGSQNNGVSNLASSVFADRDGDRKERDRERERDPSTSFSHSGSYEAHGDGTHDARELPYMTSVQKRGVG